MSVEAACQVLIVEDDPTTLLVLADLLRDAGYSVATAPNGASALDYLKQNRAPRLILLDLMMPIMDGWHFRTLQCNDPELVNIPTIVLSAQTELLQRATKIPADAYLPKPIDIDQLFVLVERYCGA